MLFVTTPPVLITSRPCASSSNVVLPKFILLALRVPVVIIPPFISVIPPLVSLETSVLDTRILPAEIIVPAVTAPVAPATDCTGAASAA